MDKNTDKNTDENTGDNGAIELAIDLLGMWHENSTQMALSLMEQQQE